MKGMKGAIGAVSLAIALAMSAASVSATERVASDGPANMVRLKDEPCASKRVLDLIKEDADLSAFEFKAATAMVDGKRFEACWRDMRGGAHLVYEDGDQGLIPDSMLKPELSI